MPQTAVITHAYTTQGIDEPAVDRQETVGVVTRRPGEAEDAFTARVTAVVANLRAKVWDRDGTGFRSLLNGKPVYEGTLSHEMVEDLDAEPEPATARERLALLGRLISSVTGTRAAPLRNFTEEVGIGKSGRGRNAVPVIRVKLALPADDLLAGAADQFDAHEFLANQNLRIIPILMFVPGDTWTPDAD